MNRIAAIILSLTLVWSQVLAAATTVSTPEPVQCGCCAGQKACCCIEASAPRPASLPAVPAAPSSTLDLTAALSKSATWTVPVAIPALIAAPTASASFSAMPLFTRYCTFLI